MFRQPARCGPSKRGSNPLTNETRTLLHYVGENDLRSARAVARGILQSNKTQKDQEFCDKLLKKMNAQDAKGIEIPYNLQSIIRTSSTAYEFSTERYYLSDREKEVLQTIRQMYTVSEQMAKLNLHYANATMLYGMSGTGKTTFAQYVAKTLDLPFLYVSITQLLDCYMGKTGQNLENVFQFASTLPCVLVLDEIDQIATKRREDGGVSGELKRVLITIMQNLDRLPNNVILIAATNRPEVIDDALMRRFPLKHEIEPLTGDEACAFVNQYMDQIGLDWSGYVLPFLGYKVKPRQVKEIEDGKFVPAIIVDCLNEAIADALYNQGPDNPVVTVDGSKIDIPEVRGAKTAAAASERIPLSEIPCPKCGQKSLRMMRYGDYLPEFPEYVVGCDECDWECPDGKSTDIGDAEVMFREGLKTNFKNN